MGDAWCEEVEGNWCAEVGGTRGCDVFSTLAV